MSAEDYEEIRKQNIAERNAIFAEFFGDVKKQALQLRTLREKSESPNSGTEDVENEPPKKRRRLTISADTRVYRTKAVRLDFRRKYNTRSRKKESRSNQANDDSESETSEYDENSEPKGNGPKLRVLFPWAKPVQRSIDLMKMGVCDVDEEDEDQLDYDIELANRKQVVRVTRSEYDPSSIPSVDEITDEMLENVAEKSSLKTYCKIRGTSCHQCRQKTLDTKTVCRSGECIGVRGQFCGPCLQGRYGESALDALKDPDWSCPPCRGLCNCSICRTRSGLRPTGILAPAAQQEGFASVKDYLLSTEID